MSTEPLAHWRSRLTGAEWVDPRTLLPHPAAWRLHPAYQREAVTASLAEYGWVDHLLASQRSRRVLDGHLRREIAIDAGADVVPVDWLDLIDDAEEREALLALDVIRAAAGIDRAKLGELLADLSTVSGQYAPTLALLRARLLPAARERTPPLARPATVDHFGAALAAEDAATPVDVLTYDDADRGKTVDEKHVDYQASGVRQIVLVCSAQDYGTALSLLAVARAHYGVQTNADAVARLLQDGPC